MSFTLFHRTKHKTRFNDNIIICFRCLTQVIILGLLKFSLYRNIYPSILKWWPNRVSTNNHKSCKYMKGQNYYAFACHELV